MFSSILEMCTTLYWHKLSCLENEKTRIKTMRLYVRHCAWLLHCPLSLELINIITGWILTYVWLLALNFYFYRSLDPFQSLTCIIFLQPNSWKGLPSVFGTAAITVSISSIYGITLPLSWKVHSEKSNKRTRENGENKKMHRYVDESYGKAKRTKIDQ